MLNYTGKTLKNYLVLEQVTKGTQGAIYKGKHIETEAPVAIKVLHTHFNKYQELVDRFEFEAVALERCRHPHIVPLLEHWRNEDGAFLVMQWINGGSLKQHLQANGALSLAQAAAFLPPITDGLHIAHQAGIIHRDIKPENILLGDNGQTPVIIDFGVAKNLATSNTVPGTTLGSPAYLAPEQLMGDPLNPVTPRTDGYALGVMIYEMLLGEHPYAGQPANRIMFKLMREPFPPIRTRRADLPESIEAFLRQATALDPNARYADMNQLCAAFLTAANSA